jgi:hypothetical protein
MSQVATLTIRDDESSPIRIPPAAFVETIEASGDADMRMTEEGQASIIEFRAVGSAQAPSVTAAAPGASGSSTRTPSRTTFEADIAELSGSGYQAQIRTCGRAHSQCRFTGAK